MSATIGINDLKFVIFGAGHDYTLADSGDGDVQVFSHPFVPLNSVMYAGMWYFLVPDENGDPIDAVKDDIAHCTFTPDIGDTFSAEGEITVECNYHREYIHDEETIIVDKTVRQTITVVNHGTVSNAAHWVGGWNDYARVDIYTDGYGFFRPYTTTEVGAYAYQSDAFNTIVKTSSIPWRASSIGRSGSPMIIGHALTDISELAYADVSNATVICLMSDTYVEDISALAEWDISNCEDLDRFLSWNSKLKDISPLLNWRGGKIRTMRDAWAGCDLTSLHGLENLDVSTVENMSGAFQNNANLTDISALLGWVTTSLEKLGPFLMGCSKLVNLHGLENFDVSNVYDLSGFLKGCSKVASLTALSAWTPVPTTLYHFCSSTSIKKLDGVENFDVSNCTNFESAFQGNYYLTNCDAVKDWDTSSGTNFAYMLQGAYWLTSLKAFEDWNFGGNCGAMFYIASVLSVSDVVFNLSRVTNYSQMFYAIEKDYSSKLGKDLIKSGTVWYDASRTMYTVGEVDDGDHPLSEYSRDASNASNWTVSGSNLGAFNIDKWSNTPAWN